MGRAAHVNREGDFATRTGSSINSTNINIYSQNNELFLVYKTSVFITLHIDKCTFNMCLLMLSFGELANISYHMEIFVIEIFPNKPLKIDLWMIPNCIFQQNHSSRVDKSP